MNVFALPDTLESACRRVAVAVEPFALLAARVYVGWVFVKSGGLKLAAWDSTLALFEFEYRVPLLSPAAAAVAGTAGELAFGALVVLGLLGRFGAAGLFAVNALAVISYRHVLLAEGFEAALAQHVLWGALLAASFVFGPGRWSVDGFRRTAAAPATLQATVS